MENNALPSSASKPTCEALSEFRYQLRRFLRFSEEAAREEGLTPLQYVMLLHVRGFPGRDWASITELAERLQLQHHGTVALLTRCEQLGLIERRRSKVDRRLVEVHLRPSGMQRLERLRQQHEHELAAVKAFLHLPQLAEFNSGALQSAGHTP